MKTDRELLELAAKASGAHFAGVDKDGAPLVAWGNALYPWSPLTSDGDAMRLAVLLDITISPDATECSASPSIGGWFDERIAAGDDKFAATRRAIVRAAASMASP
jgi:hypothetical protein